MASSRQSLSRRIIKQGYLKKWPNASKVGSSFKKAAMRWFVFGVVSNREPYLEYYENEEAIFTSQPINCISLAKCLHVQRSFNLQKKLGTVFTITLQDRVLTLEASNRHGMQDWCAAIENKLATLGILDKQEKENIYSSEFPKFAKKPLRVPTRPPPPLPDDDNNNCSPSKDSESPKLPSDFLRPNVPTTLDISSNKPASPPDSPNLTEDFLRIDPFSTPDSCQVQTSIEIMQNTTNGQLGEDFLRLDSPNDRGVSRQLFPESGQEDPAYMVYGEVWSENGGAGPQSGAPPIPERRNISGSNPTTPTTPTTPTAHPGLARQDSRPLTFVAGLARTPDGRDPHSGPMRVASRTPITGLPPLSPLSEPAPEFYSPGANSASAAESGNTVPPSPLSISVYPESPSPRTPLAGIRGGASSGLPEPEVVRTGDTEVQIVPEKMMEALGLSEEDSGVFGWNAPPPEDYNAPPVYQPRGVLNRGSNKALKFSQVEQLQREMDHAGGVKVVLRRVDCLYTVAWVNAFNRIWIAGWIQQQRPFLHTAFHVGDQVVSVNGQVVENARMVHKLVKHCSENDKITFILKRVPHARVFALKREEDGQSLGFRREGGTGEIIEVDQFGLAGKHGLPAKAQNVDGTNLCNWFLTEINSRPVNLFFKEDEIEKRLNAVGKEISFLAQPVDFVRELKKELKTNYKNYKDFIVQ